MDNLQYIENLFEKFDFPRVSKIEKFNARETIIKELDGYKAEECVSYDNRKLKRIPIHSAHTNYNIVTKCENPKYLVTAHYDNPSIYSHYMSYFSRKNGNFKKSLDVKMSLIIILLLFILFSSPIGAIYFVCREFKVMLPSTLNDSRLFLIVYIFSTVSTITILMFMGRLNYFRSTYSADDNTSGVIAVLSIAKILKEKNINNVQFAFFDNEEKRLSGSYSYLEENTISKDIKVINLDSVGRGRRIFTSGDGTNEFREEFETFLKEEVIRHFSRYKSFSDCKSFTKKGYKAFTINRGDILNIKGKKLLDISWIHTYHDTIDNIDFNRLEEVVNVVVEFIEEKYLEQVD